MINCPNCNENSSVPEYYCSKCTSLTIPLYHGTSNIFQHSIENHGLGAFNIKEELHLRPFLEHAHEIWGSETQNNDSIPQDVISKWNNWNNDIEQIISQVKRTKGGHNLSHERGDLAITREVAIDYANKYKYGSEILTFCLELYDDIKKYLPNHANDPIFMRTLKLIDTSNFIEMNDDHTKLLIKVQPPIDLSFLASQSGGNSEELLKSIKERYGVKGTRSEDLFVKRWSCKIIKPIPPEKLEIRLDPL